MFRTIYLFKMPSWSRRIRIMMDWTTDLFFRRDPVQLGVRHATRDE
jgi:NADH dehydrogenase